MYLYSVHIFFIIVVVVDLGKLLHSRANSKLTLTKLLLLPLSSKAKLFYKKCLYRVILNLQKSRAALKIERKYRNTYSELRTEERHVSYITLLKLIVVIILKLIVILKIIASPEAEW